MNNKLIPPIGILFVLLLLISGGCIEDDGTNNPPNPYNNKTNEVLHIENNTNNSLNPTQNNFNKTSYKENATETSNPSQNETINQNKENTTEETLYKSLYIEDPINEATTTVYRRKLEKNTKPSFEVGKEYRYNYTNPAKISGTNKTVIWTTVREFVVEKIEGIDGRDCYVISAAEKQVYTEESRKQAGVYSSEEYLKKSETMTHQQTSWYDKETGKLTQINHIGPGLLKNDEAEYWELRGVVFTPFSEWMLGLQDDFIWEQKSTYLSRGMAPRASNQTVEYRVLGRENVDGRECFKVEINFHEYEEYYDNRENNKAEHTYTDIIWVDVKERIIVKKEKQYDDAVTNLM
jgi:hypothetical protein